MVVADCVDEVHDHCLEFFDEGLGVILPLLYFSQFLFPDACELGALE